MFYGCNSLFNYPDFSNWALNNKLKQFNIFNIESDKDSSLGNKYNKQSSSSSDENNSENSSYQERNEPLNYIEEDAKLDYINKYNENFDNDYYENFYN